MMEEKGFARGMTLFSYVVLIVFGVWAVYFTINS